jgi:hypothetical protein
MTMTQLVVGSALGCLLSQMLLFGGRLLLGAARRAAPGMLRAPAAAKAGALFVKYAAPVSVAAALVILGVWTVSDYLAGRAHGTAQASTLAPGTLASPVHGATDQALHATPSDDAPAPSNAVDPYSDPDFKVQRRGGHAAASSLKEALLQRAEAKASADLRHEIQQHQQRSQYDCETAERVDRYLKAGLDVWGFTAWQQRYFPMHDYKGATLAECKDIKAQLPSSVDLQSAVALSH